MPNVTQQTPKTCPCGRRIHRSKTGILHDHCSQCRNQPRQPKTCECGARFTSVIHDRCSKCRSNVTKRWCTCGHRIYDGQPTCTACRYAKRQPEILWEKDSKGIFRAVYVDDPQADTYPRRGR